MAQCISTEFQKIGDQQDLKIFLQLFNPFTLVMKKTSKKKKFQKNKHMDRQEVSYHHCE